MTRDDVMRDTLAHVRKVGRLLMEVVQNLQTRAMRHDDSKFTPEEYPAFEAATPGLNGLTYGTPEYEKSTAALGKALEHHYRNNDHHPQHHADGIHGMDMIQLIELLADWYAAGQRHANGSLVASIQKNAERFGYDRAFALLLARTATNLGWMKETEFIEMQSVKP